MQVLYPWRRIFQQMFNHDRMAGALYCMWESDMRSNHAVITQLGARCRAAFDDYAAVQSLLINTLDMQVLLIIAMPSHLLSFLLQTQGCCASKHLQVAVCLMVVSVRFDG